MRVVLLGPPASGKGTQGHLLSERYGVPHVATGDLIREEIERGTEKGKRFRCLTESGDFISDDDVHLIVADRLSQSDAARGYILDGFPRDVAQAKLFASGEGKLLDGAVMLNIDESALAERLGGRWTCPMCGSSYHIAMRPPRVPGVCDVDGSVLVRRPDDEPEAIARRFSIYHARTAPLLAYYAGLGLLVTVDATVAPDLLANRIFTALAARA